MAFKLVALTVILTIILSTCCESRYFPREESLPLGKNPDESSYRRAANSADDSVQFDEIKRTMKTYHDTDSEAAGNSRMVKNHVQDARSKYRQESSDDIEDSYAIREFDANSDNHVAKGSY